jgi:hypothetical protein
MIRLNLKRLTGFRPLNTLMCRKQTQSEFGNTDNLVRVPVKLKEST